MNPVELRSPEMVLAGYCLNYHHGTQLATEREGRDAGMQDSAPRGFAVVDLETTGLYPRTDRMVELAVVQVQGDPQSRFPRSVPGRSNAA